MSRAPAPLLGAYTNLLDTPVYPISPNCGEGTVNLRTLASEIHPNVVGPHPKPGYHASVCNENPSLKP